eukprot:gene21067-27297_t
MRKTPDGPPLKTLLFCDNLDSQVHEGFLHSLHELDASRYCLPPGETEMTQPIDGGCGAVVKMIIGQIQDEWLDVEGNLDAWEGDPNATYKLDASMRRILITKWVGEAWERLTTYAAYKDTFRRCFEVTGALITADGTDDNLIRPMRGLDYTVPLSIIDLTIDRVLEEQNNLAADAEGDPEDENEERENVHILGGGEVVDNALDTEDVDAVITLLLERPSAIDIAYAEGQTAARGDQNGTTALEDEEENYNEQPTAAAVLDGREGGGEEENRAAAAADDENEIESWKMGLENSELQDGALKPILDASMARPRIGFIRA